MLQERYELAIGRIEEMKDEQTVSEPFCSFFHHVSDFILLIDKLNKSIQDGSYYQLPMEELKNWNQKLYFDILPEQYGMSFANPDYAVAKLGEKHGKLLSFLYTEIRGMIPYCFEKNIEYMDILLELFLGVYNQYEMNEEPDESEIKSTIYWFASDYCDVFLADRIREQLCPEKSFATEIILNSDLNDLRYLYYFGEYISENERKTAEFLNKLPEETIQKMADVYTEGYRVGFVNTGKDLSKKSVVNIRYIVGFERVVKKAIENFKKLGLDPVIYRASVSVITKRQHIKIGYYGGIPNPQYEYDHRNDQALFFDKKYMERKLEVIKTTYEEQKKQARQFAGPACIEMFGEIPFTPEQKDSVIKLSPRQEEYSLQFDSKQSQITNQYIHADERSFTIIAYPVPAIGEKYEEIFEEIIKINTLDAKLYEEVQQKIIDALDQGEYVRVLGGNGNRTDLKIQLHTLKDSSRETIFENCVADVNIPVGEVFTTPVLKGTDGVLHVSKVYLNELQYKDLEVHFKDGWISDYTCKNFADEEENKKFVQENVLFKHPTIPMGEFAIGTNTTAYMVAKKYDIADKMPILIAEKMGPHFAVGDTCYSWAEDIKVYNPNGKEIIARDNEASILRKTDLAKAYFQCHTDITIPYEELKSISVIKENGEEIPIISEGRFVLEGTKVLNKALENYL